MTTTMTTTQANALARAACARVLREARSRHDAGVNLVIARIAARHARTA